MSANTKKQTQQSRKQLQQQAKLRKARLKNAPTLVVMVGLPGSGKSTFAQRLESSSDGGWVRVCQDELGSRGATEEACSRVVLGGNKKKSNNGTNRCILDGCHVTPQLRKRWLTTAMNPKRAIAIHYTTPTEVCKRRAAARTDHPTGDLFAWGGATIIDTKAKNLSPPTTEEGFEKVHQVSTIDEANALLFALGGIPFDEETVHSWNAAPGGDNSSKKNDFRQCRESDTLNAEMVIQMLGFSDDDVDNIYVYGSRLWGTATENSDFDFIIVCKSPDVKKQATHVGNRLDAMVMGRGEFQERLADGDFLVTLCQYLPEAAVWRERWHPTDAPQLKNKKKSGGKDASALNSASVLSVNVLDKFDRNLKLAAKHFSKGAEEKAKKVLSHVMRMLILATQMVHEMVAGSAVANDEPVATTTLLDIDQANQHHEKIMNHDNESWDSFLQLVESDVVRYRALLGETQTNVSNADKKNAKGTKRK